LHQELYEGAFQAADRVVFAPLGRSEIAAGERLDLERLVEALRGRGAEAEASPSVDAICARIVAEARPGDTVALLSNGAFGGIHDKLRGALEHGSVAALAPVEGPSAPSAGGAS
jgi:UDP-N-acetylmuramate: L-alanyl-gamma-D-glutamyl-meso-diaminopimelate ligase